MDGGLSIFTADRIRSSRLVSSVFPFTEDYERLDGSYIGGDSPSTPNPLEREVILKIIISQKSFLWLGADRF